MSFRKEEDNIETYDNSSNKDNQEYQEYSKMIAQQTTKPKEIQIEDDEENKENVNDDSLVGKMRQILHSHRFHIVILILVLIDCCLVAGELIIDYIEIHMAKDHNASKGDDKSFLLTKQSDLDQAYKNATDHHHDNHGDSHHNSGFAKFLKVLELICKYGSFSILTFFVLEIIVKFIITPKNFCVCFEVFDAVVVIVSWSVNLFLLIAGVAIHALSGLLVIFR